MYHLVWRQRSQYTTKKSVAAGVFGPAVNPFQRLNNIPPTNFCHGLSLGPFPSAFPLELSVPIFLSQIIILWVYSKSSFVSWESVSLPSPAHSSTSSDFILSIHDSWTSSARTTSVPLLSVLCSSVTIGLSQYLYHVCSSERMRVEVLFQVMQLTRIFNPELVRQRV